MLKLPDSFLMIPLEISQNHGPPSGTESDNSFIRKLRQLSRSGLGPIRADFTGPLRVEEPLPHLDKQTEADPEERWNVDESLVLVTTHGETDTDDRATVARDLAAVAIDVYSRKREMQWVPYQLKRQKGEASQG